MPGDDELLTAYLDGVAELTPDERRRVEAAIVPAEAETTRSVLRQLRELSPQESDNEPDWSAMERSISAAVGTRVPRPWWSISWRWALPVVACAAAAIAIVVVARPDATTPEPIAHVEAPKPVPVEPAPAKAMVYLDGEAMDIDNVDPAVLDELEAPDVADEDNLIPNDQWVDQLDDRALDRAERVLRKKKS